MIPLDILKMCAAPMNCIGAVHYKFGWWWGEVRRTYNMCVGVEVCGCGGRVVGTRQEAENYSSRAHAYNK